MATMRETCIEALQKNHGTAQDIAEATGVSAGSISGILGNLYYEGLADRENIGTGKTPNYRYSLNNPPKAKRKKPAPVPRKSAAKQDAPQAPAVVKKTPQKPRKAAAPAVEVEPTGALPGLFDALAKAIAAELVGRIVANVEAGLSEAFKK